MRFSKLSLWCEPKHGQGDSVQKQAADLYGNANANATVTES